MNYLVTGAAVFIGSVTVENSMLQVMMLLKDKASRKQMGSMAHEVLKASLLEEAVASQIIDAIEKAE